MSLKGSREGPKGWCLHNLWGRTGPKGDCQYTGPTRTSSSPSSLSSTPDPLCRDSPDRSVARKLRPAAPATAAGGPRDITAMRLGPAVLGAVMLGPAAGEPLLGSGAAPRLLRSGCPAGAERALFSTASSSLVVHVGGYTSTSISPARNNPHSLCDVQYTSMPRVCQGLQRGVGAAAARAAAWDDSQPPTRKSDVM